MSTRPSYCDYSAGTEPEGTYAVGYGRPPKHTRFKPGQSGNYRGRPKGSRNLQPELCKVLTGPVTVTEGGKRRRVPALKALHQVVLQQALKGDFRAAQFVFKTAKELGLLAEAETDACSDCGVLSDKFLERLSDNALREIVEISKQIANEEKQSKETTRSERINFGAEARES